MIIVETRDISDSSARSQLHTCMQNAIESPIGTHTRGGHLNSYYSKENGTFLHACPIIRRYNDNNNKNRTHRGKDARNANLLFKNKQRHRVPFSSSSSIHFYTYYFHSRLVHTHRRIITAGCAVPILRARFVLFFCFWSASLVASR